MLSRKSGCRLPPTGGPVNQTSLSDDSCPEESVIERKPGSLWIRKDLATFCGVSEECVRKWERLGEGPPRARSQAGSCATAKRTSSCGWRSARRPGREPTVGAPRPARGSDRMAPESFPNVITDTERSFQITIPRFRSPFPTKRCRPGVRPPRRPPAVVVGALLWLGF